MLNWTHDSVSLIFFVPLFHALLYVSAQNQGLPSSMDLELMHRHSHAKTDQLDRIRELIQSDMARRQMTSKNHALELELKKNGGNKARMRIRSAHDYGVAAYQVKFKVGSPGKHFMLAADTGSDLTWMKCKYQCTDNCSINTENTVRKRVFDADLSSTFKTIPCSTTMCKDDLFHYWSMPSVCPSPLAPCTYNYSYLDHSFAVGIFAKETVSARLGNKRLLRLHNVLIGCTESPSGFQAVDGVMGLGFSKYSFTKKASNIFGGKFSYCLVDHLSSKNVSSYLTFGENVKRKSKLRKMEYTKLGIGVISPYYMVNLTGISIAGKMLNVTSELWDIEIGGGTIVDSGTSLTTLAPQAYEQVMGALEVPLRNFERVNISAPLEFCFNSTGFCDSLVPRLAFHFADGARFKPLVKSYIIDVKVGVKCIGLTVGTSPGLSIIGNIMQQKYFWEFDLINKKLGYAPSSCI